MMGNGAGADPLFREFVTVQMPADKLVLPMTGNVVGVGMPRFSELIRGFSYKPGYEFTLVHHEQAQIRDDETGRMLTFGSDIRFSHLHLKCYVPDSTRPPHEPYLLQFSAAIPHYIEDQPEEGQVHYLYEILRTFELHELDEWYRLNGKLVKNPHA